MTSMHYQRFTYLSITGLGIIAALFMLARWGTSTAVQTAAFVLAMAVLAALAYGIACPLTNMLTTLRIREARFRLFSEVAVEGIFIQENGTIIDANDTLAALLGSSRESLIGQDMVSFVAPESRATVVEHMARGFEQPYEVVGVRRDGMRFPMEMSSRKVIYLSRHAHAFAVHDLSSRQLMETILKSSEARFRQIAEHVNNVFWICSPNLDQVIYVSPAYKTIWQRACADLYEHPHLMIDAIHPDDRDAVLRALHSQQEQCGELRIVRPDGSIRWVWSRAFPICNEQGAVYRIVGVAEDITERKQAEMALQENEATIRGLYDIASAKLMSFDERLHAVLTMGCRRFGLPFGMLTRYADEQFHVIAAVTPNGLINAGDVIAEQKTFCGTTVGASEPVCITHAGATHWRDDACYIAGRFEVYFGVAITVHGQVYGTFCFASSVPRQDDFTEHERDVLRLMAQWVSGEIERQLAEEAIKQQYRAASRAQSESRAVLDATSDAMTLVSPTGVFLSVNRRFIELLAMPASAIIGRTFQSFVPELRHLLAEPAIFLQRFGESALDSVNPLVDTVIQVHPQRRELTLLSTPIHSQDGYIGRLYTFRDVTDAHAIDQMKSDFVSMVSHELRTPLTCIKGYVDMLLDGEVGRISPVQVEYLGIVKENSDRLMMLINDLLDVTRADSGTIELRCDATDFSRIMHNVLRALLPQMQHKRQQLTLDIQESLPLIWCDADRVTQIMTNLISNAHKYTPPGGTISIHAHAQDGTLSVAVQDNGVGISVGDHAHVFRRFFRAKHAATKDVGGTGLGLVITRSLVELHGGSMGFESELGSGSVFRFTLPVSRHSKEPDHD